MKLEKKAAEAWVKHPLDQMSPLVRQKAEAWVMAEAAARDAKKAFTDTASMAARKAKVIGPNQYLAYANKWGQLSYLVKDADSPGAAAPDVAPRF